MLLKLLCGVGRSRFDSMVISLTGTGPVADMIAKLGVRVEALDLRISPLGTFARLIGLLREIRPQVIQTWLYHADLAGLLARPFVPHTHLCWNLRCAELGSGDVPFFTRMLARLLGAASRFPDLVIANSQAGRAAHRRIGYRPRRWEVIYNGFDAARFVPDAAARETVRLELGLEADAMLVGLVARYHPMKDHENFLRGAALIRGKCHDARFLLAGRDVTAENTRLMACVNSLGLGGSIHLLGERADMPTITAALDVACSSSFSEGFPNTVGEAMSCAVPCVATNVGDTAYLLGSGGIAVPPRDPTALAEACVRLLQMSKEDRSRIGMLGRTRILEEFSIDRIVARYEGIYAQLSEK